MLKDDIEASTGFKIEACPRCGFLMEVHEKESDCIRILKLKVDRLQHQVEMLKSKIIEQAAFNGR